MTTTILIFDGYADSLPYKQDLLMVKQPFLYLLLKLDSGGKFNQEKIAFLLVHNMSNLDQKYFFTYRFSKWLRFWLLCHNKKISDNRNMALQLNFILLICIMTWKIKFHIYYEVHVNSWQPEYFKGPPLEKLDVFG